MEQLTPQMQELANRCPILNAAITCFEMGNLTYTQALEVAFNGLHVALSGIQLQSTEDKIRQHRQTVFPAEVHPWDELLVNGHGFFLVFDGDENGWPHVLSYNQKFKDVQNGWQAPGVTDWMMIPKVGGV